MTVVFLFIVLVVSGLYWFAHLLLVLKSRAALPLLSSLPAGELAQWPMVSLVVPARDEGAAVKAALAAVGRGQRQARRPPSALAPSTCFAAAPSNAPLGWSG